MSAAPVPAAAPMAAPVPALPPRILPRIAPAAAPPTTFVASPAVPDLPWIAAPIVSIE